MAAVFTGTAPLRADAPPGASAVAHAAAPQAAPPHVTAPHVTPPHVTAPPRAALHPAVAPEPRVRPEPGVSVSRIGGVYRITRPPHPALRPYVRGRAGYTEAVASPYRVRLVPNGSAVVVINLGEPFTAIRRLGEAGPTTGRIGSLVVGLEDRAAFCDHPGGQEAVRLELTPPGAYRLFGLPMGELTNRIAGLGDVLGPAGDLLVARMAETRSWAARFDLLDEALVARFREGPAPAPEVDHAWRLLCRSGGNLPVARLADEVGWSRTYLVRRFSQQIGLKPKACARVLRFHSAVGLLNGGDAGLAEVSARCGYCDQAHLSREFKALAGITPVRMAAGRWVEGALKR